MIVSYNGNKEVMALLVGIFGTTLWSSPAWAASNTRGLTTSTTTQSGVITFPLIPHHVQRQRRGLSALEDYDTDTETENGILYDETTTSTTPWSFDPHHRRQQAKQVGALYHGYGTHYMDLWCGTPPQRQTVIVDTGSGVTAFPCDGCQDCGGAPAYHIDKYFQQGSSETFEKMSCQNCQRGTCYSGGDECKLSMSYQEGSSWYAFEARDTCYVGGPHNIPLQKDYLEIDTSISETSPNTDIDPDIAKHFAFPLTFGCQTKLTGLFKTQLADGIMGMENTNTAFWKQMYKAGKMGNYQQFSLCFSRPVNADRKGTEAGAMTLGGVEPRFHDTDMVFTDGTGSSGFFNVNIRAVFLRHGEGGESARSAKPDANIIKLNVESSALNSGHVIVDSGTTDTYFNRAISSAFRAAFKQLSGKEYSHTSMTMTAEELAKLPTILFQLQGDEQSNKFVSGDSNPNEVTGLAGDLDPDHPYDVILAMPPSHYMELDSSGKYTARFYDTEGGGSVLGANAMMGHDILFDADKMKLGWAESTCDYKNLITNNGFTDVLEETEETVASHHQIVDSSSSSSSEVAQEVQAEVTTSNQNDVDEELASVMEQITNTNEIVQQAAEAPVTTPPGESENEDDAASATENEQETEVAVTTTTNQEEESEPLDTTTNQEEESEPVDTTMNQEEESEPVDTATNQEEESAPVDTTTNQEEESVENQEESEVTTTTTNQEEEVQEQEQEEGQEESETEDTESEEEEEEEVQDETAVENMDNEIIDNANDQKKDHPSSSSASHENQSPKDDIKKVFQGLACDSNTCRGGLLGAIIILVLLCCCCGRSCFPRKKPTVTKKYKYEHAEVELSSYTDEDGYKDDPEAGEFGDFESGDDDELRLS